MLGQGSEKPSPVGDTAGSTSGSGEERGFTCQEKLRISDEGKLNDCENGMLCSRKVTMSALSLCCCKTGGRWKIWLQSYNERLPNSQTFYIACYDNDRAMFRHTANHWTNVILSRSSSVYRNWKEVECYFLHCAFPSQYRDPAALLSDLTKLLLIRIFKEHHEYVTEIEKRVTWMIRWTWKYCCD